MDKGEEGCPRPTRGPERCCGAWKFKHGAFQNYWISQPKLCSRAQHYINVVVVVVAVVIFTLLICSCDVFRQLRGSTGTSGSDVKVAGRATSCLPTAFIQSTDDWQPDVT